jgi:hypothetical protein
MGFPQKARAERQKVIDDYLNQTGRNMFIPGEFLEWLQDKNDHQCWAVFYGQSDADAAQEHRKQMVRQWVSGLRLKVSVETSAETKGAEVRVTEYSVPAMLSPMTLRKLGGGYYVTNSDDPSHIAELAEQAATSLESWLSRHGGVAEIKGCDLAAIKEIVGQLRAAHVSAAA